jgi:hypothetical protein
MVSSHVPSHSIVWYSYNYSIDTPKEHLAGHGFAMYRKTEGHWRVLNMHNSQTGLDYFPIVLEADKSVRSRILRTRLQMYC